MIETAKKKIQSSLLGIEIHNISKYLYQERLCNTNGKREKLDVQFQAENF